MDKKVIGERLKKLRGDKTVRQVAADLGLSYSALSMYECGQRTPKDNIKIMLADYYGTSVEDLFFTAKSTMCGN